MRPRISIWGRVRRMVGPCVTCFFNAENERLSLWKIENHRGSPTLTLLNVLGVPNVLYVLNVPMDASLACCALLSEKRHKLCDKGTWSSLYQMGLRGVGTHRKRLAHTLKEFSSKSKKFKKVLASYIILKAVCGKTGGVDAVLRTMVIQCQK